MLLGSLQLNLLQQRHKSRKLNSAHLCPRDSWKGGNNFVRHSARSFAKHGEVPDDGMYRLLFDLKLRFVHVGYVIGDVTHCVQHVLQPEFPRTVCR